MTTYLLHDGDGRAVSIGTVLAEEISPSLTIVELSEAEAEGLRSGRKVWDAASRQVVDTPARATSTSAEERLDIIKAKLAELEPLAAPVVAADILDVLAEIQEAI